MNQLDIISKFGESITARQQLQSIPPAISSKSKNQGKKKHNLETNYASSSFVDWTTNDDFIPFSKVLNYLKRDIKISYVIYTLNAFSLGRGYHNTANTETPSGRRCLDLIDEFAKDWKFKSLIPELGLDGWASGNEFINVPGKGETIDGVYRLPLSTIVDINIDEDNEVVSYIQKDKLGSITEIDADQIKHFKWWPIDSSKWGEGIIQPLLRKGAGYRASNGATLRRPSWAEMNEVFAHTNMNMFYSGQSKYVITPEGDYEMDAATRDHLADSFNKLNPLQHIVSPKKIKVEAVALSSESKWNTLTDRFDKEFSIGTKTSLMELATSLDFSYASSQTALQSSLPLIHAFESAQKTFIEESIYYPLIIQAGKNPEIIKPEINWGANEKITIDDILKIQQILTAPDLLERHDPRDIISMLLEAGVPLPLTDKMEAQQESNANFYHDIETANTKEQFNNVMAKYFKN